VAASFTCDRCRVPIPADRTTLAVQCGPMKPHRPAVDLCLACAGEFVAFLKAPSSSSSAIDRTESRGGTHARADV